MCITVVLNCFLIWYNIQRFQTVSVSVAFMLFHSPIKHQAIIFCILMIFCQIAYIELNRKPTFKSLEIDDPIKWKNHRIDLRWFFYSIEKIVSKACDVRRVHAEQNVSEFTKLFPLMSVEFVRSYQHTVTPFPFKYLREVDRPVKDEGLL